MRGVRLSLLAVSIAACGDDAPSHTDIDAGPTIAIDPPAPPQPPDFGECLPGYSGGGAEPCRPYDEGEGPSECPEGEAHFPGEPGCVVVGDPCGEDAWASGLPAGEQVLYVRAGATPGGSGSRLRPYATPTEALANASPGATIALAAGSYPSFRVGFSARVIGACATRTTIAGPDVPNVPAIFFTGGTSALENVTIDADDAVAVGVAGAGGLDLDGVIVRSGIGGVYTAQGATLRARSFVVRSAGAAVAPAGFEPGVGLYVEGGESSLTRALILGAAHDGIVVSLDGTLTVDRTYIRGGAGAGRGIEVTHARMIARGVMIQDTHVLSLAVHDPSLGASTFDQGVIDGVLFGNDPEEIFFARGPTVQSGGELSVTRSAIAHTPESALNAIAGGRLVASDVQLRPATTIGSATVGRGVTIVNAEAELHRVDVEGAVINAVHAETSATIVATDLHVAGTRGNPQTGDSIAITSQTGSFVDLERIELIDSISGALGALEGVVAARDVLVRDVGPHPMFGMGDGLIAQDGVMTIERARVEHTLEAAVLVAGVDARLEARMLDVRDSAPGACGEASCPGGIGVATFARASATIDSFAFDDLALCGILLAENASLDLVHGHVSRAPFGACVQIPGYDLARLENDVVYRTDQTLETTALPIPTILPPLE